MQVIGVEVRRLELELVRPMVTSAGTHRRRPVVLVRIVTDAGSGWGECDALVEATYTAETADDAEGVLIETLAPCLFERPLAGAVDALTQMAQFSGNPMAKASVEMAILDIELRSEARSLADRLGASRMSIPAGATIGIGTIDEVVAAVDEALSAGFRRIKCKIEPGRDLDQLRALRANFPMVDLTADANGSYRLDDATHRAALEQIDRLGLLAIEQPLGAHALTDSARLASDLETLVLLDESVESDADLELVADLSAGDGVVIKPARIGGLLAARRMHDRCLERGLKITVGGMFETGLGRGASLAVAALPGVDLPGDLGPSNRYFATDLTAPHEMVDGMLAVPRGPGLGVELIDSLVDAATIRSTVLGMI